MTRADDTKDFHNQLMIVTKEEESNSYSCPLLFYYLILPLDLQFRRSTLKYLITKGKISLDASKGAVDSEGRDVFMLAVI